MVEILPLEHVCDDLMAGRGCVNWHQASTKKLTCFLLVHIFCFSGRSIGSRVIS